MTVIPSNTYKVDLDVRFGDFDMYGHLNNAVYLRLIEEARIRYIKTALKDLEHDIPEGLLADNPQATLGDFLPQDIFFVVGSNKIEYLRPFDTLGSSVTLHMWVSSIGDSSYVLDYIFTDIHEESIIYAQAETVVIAVDAKTGKPVHIPAELKSILEKNIREPLNFRS